MPDMILHLKRHDAASIPKFKQQLVSLQASHHGSLGQRKERLRLTVFDLWVIYSNSFLGIVPSNPSSPRNRRE